jgi:hypothetical protein
VVIRITTYRKERRYEPREIYRHGRPPGNDLGCSLGFPGQVDHGKYSGDEKRRKELLETPGFSPRDWPSVDPTYFEK